MGKRLKRAFQRRGSMAKKLTERCSTSFKEIQINVIMRYPVYGKN